MKRFIRISVRVLLGCVVLLIALVALLYLYVNRNREQILAKIQGQFHQACSGTLSIGDVQPDLFSQFPNVALSMRDVVVRDSLWDYHHHDLLRVKRIDVTADVLSMLRGKIIIHKLSFHEGAVFLFDDSNHYSNRYIFRKNKPQTGGSKELFLKKLELQDFRFTIVNTPRKKHFDFLVHHLRGSVDAWGDVRRFSAASHITIQQCIFNQDKGSFLKGKDVHSRLSFSYDNRTGILSFPASKVQVNGTALNVSAAFDFNQVPELFELSITANKLLYTEALSWLSPNISRKLDSFTFARPIGLQVAIKGRMRDQPTPSVQLTCQVQQNELHTAAGVFGHCSFTGSYRNGTPGDTVFGDERSVIRLYNLEASWNDISFRSDSFLIHNLKAPQVSCALHSGFQVQALNNVLGNETFIFDKGAAQLDLVFRGSMNPNDTISSHLSGNISIRDAGFTYAPRNLSFTDCFINLDLDDQGITLTNARFNSPGSSIQLSVSAPRFLALYHKAPQQIVLDTRLNSTNIDLNEFRTFLGKRNGSRPQKAKIKKGLLADRIDKALDASTVNLRMDVKTLKYKKFSAGNIIGDISMQPAGIALRQVQFLYAGGHVSLQGFIYQDDDVINAFRIISSMQHVAVNELFTAFGNFGQRTLLAENIRGSFSMNSTVSGRIGETAGVVPGSLNGSVHFSLDNGELKDFKPLERMGRFAFRKKRLSDVHFKNISNTFGIEGNRIIIPPMIIASDLITMKMQGVFNLDIGTDLQMEIPLLAAEELTLGSLVTTKGLQLHIRGKDDENGNLKFSLNMGDKAEKLKRKEERRERKERRQRRKALWAS